MSELVRALRNSDKPLIVFMPREPNEDERKQLNQLGRRAERTRVATSPAQLQDDVALILHRPFETLPLVTQAALQQLRRCDPLLVGRKIVVIDDDIRNIFSLTSALEEHGVELHYAESGRSGIEILNRMPDVDAVLVDIMMPGMDGYQTMQEIRTMPGFEHLPVIAVTAKAMKGDRQKCIEAGASDYVAKPVDIDQLVSVLRVWFQRTRQARALDRGRSPNVVTFRSATGQV
jgi:CheY-like chemotaxis protein